MSDPLDKLASALIRTSDQRAESHFKMNKRDPEKAVCIQVSPLRIKLFSNDLILEKDDVILAFGVTPKKGEALMVHELPTGEFYIGQAGGPLHGSAVEAGTVDGGAITPGTLPAAAIPDNSITDAKIVDLTGSKIIDGTVGNAELAAGIDGAKLTDGTVTNPKIVGLDGAKLTDATVTNAKIVGLDGAKLTDNTVTNPKIVSVDGAKITGTVSTSAISDASWATKTTAALAARSIFSSQVWGTGISGQIAAGRVLTVADFTGKGLAAPKALWNFSNALTDASGNGYTLTNGGGVTFDKGITGAANECAKFNGGATAYLTGPNALKMPFGSVGFWFKTSRIATEGNIFTWQDATGVGGIFRFVLVANGRMAILVSTNTNDLSNYWATQGNHQKKCDDGRWHFITATWDGNRLIAYIDGELDCSDAYVVGTASKGAAYQHASNTVAIGCIRNPGTTLPYLGWIDELFMTEQVLTLEHHRWLYAAKVTNNLGVVPTNMELVLERRAPTGVLVSGDFPTQPLVGYNFSSANMNTDNYGSLGRTLTPTNTPVSAPDVDGSKGGSAFLLSGNTQYFAASDTSLPSGTAACTVGCWSQYNDTPNNYRCMVGWGNFRGIYYANTNARLHVNGGTGGGIDMGDFYNDGRWHFCAMIVESSGFDGATVRAYVDGRIVGVSNAAITTSTLVGANGLQIGTQNLGSYLFIGAIGNVFICNYAMTAEELFKVYAKQGPVLDKAPIDASSFIEGIDSSYVYLIADTLDPRSTLELRSL